MKTIRSIFVFAVLLSFLGCIRSVPWGSEDTVPERDSKNSEKVIPEVAEAKLTENAPVDNGKSGYVNVEEKKESLKRESLKRESLKRESLKRESLKKEVAGLSEETVKDTPVVKKRAEIKKPAPEKSEKKSEKKVVKSVSVKMDVRAEKPAPLKKSVEKTKKTESVSDSSGVDVLTIIIPLRKVRGTSQFIPKVMRVKAGEKVLWVNQDTRTHFINKKPEISRFSVMVDVDEDEEEDDDDDGTKNTGFSNSPLIHKGEKWSQVFTQKGTYNYYCFTHPLEMRGTIVVE